MYFCSVKDVLTIMKDATLCPVEQREISVRLAVADVTALMEDEALLAAAITRLSPQRRAKAESFGNLRSRALSTGVTLLFDFLLQEQGLRECDMEYVEGEHGKPRILQPSSLPADRRLMFNFSHSGRMAAVALATIHNEPLSLGVDVQRITHYRPELVRRVFNAHNRAELAACTTEDARERLFAQMWCRAEAYAKATGEGLHWPFPTPTTTAHFTDFDVTDEYCGSLCVFTN